MVMPLIRGISPQEYLERERKAETKSEYYDGVIVAMAGASTNHVRINVNVIAILHSQLRGTPCETLSMDMRVHTEGSLFYGYPDVLVVCGDIQYDDAKKDTVLNPVVVIETLSPSTERRDRGVKFAHYQKMAALQEYVLIAQDKVRVERFLRQPDGQWLLSIYDDIQQSLPLTTLNCTLPLTEIYERVTFATEEISSNKEDDQEV